ncbi:MAG: deoxynucleoside kinase [Leptospiraceae bacterium]|nr:deoxynucleoside kinase [Leptospiraceae bacterium]MCP5496605.1 deoxynucleoside kinase [Leptospiraceae bacterium]
MSNLFISFEGVDGSGKTTLANMVTESLGYKYMSSVPELLNPLLPEMSKTKSPLVTFNFFSLCNQLRSIEIKKLISENGIVIDRYIFSTYSYHRLVLGEDVDASIRLIKNIKHKYLMDKIVTVANITVDLSRIKAIKLNEYRDLGKINLLTIEYDSRTEYSKNPFTGKVEKKLISDQIVKEFPDYETAKMYRDELEFCWKTYSENEH